MMRVTRRKARRKRKWTNQRMREHDKYSDCIAQLIDLLCMLRFDFVVVGDAQKSKFIRIF